MDAASRLTLPAPATPASGFGETRRRLDPALDARIDTLARRLGLTRAIVFQGAWMLLLARLANTQAITVGVTRGGRPAELTGIERAVGLFIDTLPLHRRVDAAMAVADWLRDLQDVQSDQERHGHLGLGAIRRLAGVGGASLFDALFVFENYPIVGADRRFAGLAVTEVDVRDAAHYPVTLAVLPDRASAPTLCLTYRRDRLDAATSERMLDWLVRLLGAIADRPEAPLGTLDLLDDSERRQVLNGFNATARTWPARRRPCPVSWRRRRRAAARHRAGRRRRRHRLCRARRPCQPARPPAARPWRRARDHRRRRARALVGAGHRLPRGAQDRCRLPSARPRPSAGTRRLAARRQRRPLAGLDPGHCRAARRQRRPRAAGRRDDPGQHRRTRAGRARRQRKDTAAAALQPRLRDLYVGLDRSGPSASASSTPAWSTGCTTSASALGSTLPAASAFSPASPSIPASSRSCCRSSTAAARCCSPTTSAWTRAPLPKSPAATA